MNITAGFFCSIELWSYFFFLLMYNLLLFQCWLLSRLINWQLIQSKIKKTNRCSVYSKWCVICSWACFTQNYPDRDDWGPSSTYFQFSIRSSCLKHFFTILLKKSFCQLINSVIVKEIDQVCMEELIRQVLNHAFLITCVCLLGYGSAGRVPQNQTYWGDLY